MMFTVGTVGRRGGLRQLLRGPGAHQPIALAIERTLWTRLAHPIERLYLNHCRLARL